MDSDQDNAVPARTHSHRRSEPSHDRVLFVGLAITAIWVSVALLGIFAPDMVTGSPPDHIPIIGIFAWIGALMATKHVVAFSKRASITDRWMWIAYAIGVSAVWAAVALIGIFCPSLVTGTDPTTIPIAGLIAPFAGAAATGLVGEFLGSSKEAAAPNPA